MLDREGTKYEYDNDKHIKMIETVLVLNRGLDETDLPQYAIIVVDEPPHLLYDDDLVLTDYAKSKMAFVLSQEAVNNGGATYVDFNSSACVHGGKMEQYANDDINVYIKGVTVIIAPDDLEEILIEKDYAVPVKRIM